MDKSNCGVEDYAEIKKHFNAIREREVANFNRVCYQRVEALKSNTADCWCRKAGDDGRDLPCPPVS
jgi:hypothetical protein